MDLCRRMRIDHFQDCQWWNLRSDQQAKAVSVLACESVAMIRKKKATSSDAAHGELRLIPQGRWNLYTFSFKAFNK